MYVISKELSLDTRNTCSTTIYEGLKGRIYILFQPSYQSQKQLRNKRKYRKKLPPKIIWLQFFKVNSIPTASYLISFYFLPESLGIILRIALLNLARCGRYEPSISSFLCSFISVSCQYAIFSDRKLVVSSFAGACSQCVWHILPGSFQTKRSSFNFLY